jgi:hypothetical protein
MRRRARSGIVGHMSTRKLAVWFTLASAILFAALVIMQIGSGATQQFFELVHPPAVYAGALVAHAGWLRAVIAVDDIFIGCYVGAAIFSALALPRGPATWMVLAGGVAVGLIDLEENHHMLALLRAAQDGLPIDLAQIIRRMDASSVKFALGHLSFFFLAFLVPGRSAAARAARVVCGAIELPLGIAGVVWDGAVAVQLGRAVCFTAAYLLLALVLARLPEAVALGAGSGAPASRPGTMPGAAA